MRHHKTNRKFGRDASQRKALLRSLAEALIREGKIVTTEAKAKELRSYAEKLVTLAKNDILSTRRLLISKLGTHARTLKLMSEIGPRYKERKGGYTRVVKLPRRLSDGSNMALIEWV